MTLICNSLKLVSTFLSWDKSIELIETNKAVNAGQHVTNELVHPINLKPYHQVFSIKHGFISDVSILDLIFNLGIDAAGYLDRSGNGE